MLSCEMTNASDAPSRHHPMPRGVAWGAYFAAGPEMSELFTFGGIPVNRGRLATLLHRPSPHLPRHVRPPAARAPQGRKVCLPVRLGESHLPFPGREHAMQGGRGGKSRERKAIVTRR